MLSREQRRSPVASGTVPVSDPATRRIRAPAFTLAALCILGMAIAVQCIDIRRPFVDRHDWATSHQAQFARNHLRYGLSYTKTMCVYSRYREQTAHSRQNSRARYPDHPPLLSLHLALSMWTFGTTEWAVRLVPACFWVLSLAFLMSVLRGLYGNCVALLAGAAMVPMPIFVYFGHTANHEPLVLGYAMVALRGYLGWLLPEKFGRQAGRDAVIFIVGIMLGILSGWAGILFAAAMWLHFSWNVFRGNMKGTPASWFLLTVPAAIAVVGTFTHVLWSMHWNWHHLWSLFAYRSGIEESEEAFTTWAWLARQGEWLWRDYTTTGLAVAGLGAAYLVRSYRSKTQRDCREGISLLWLLAFPGLMYVLLLRSGSYIHEYWWTHCTPLMAALIAHGVLWIARVTANTTRPFIFIAACVVIAAMSWETATTYNYFRRYRNIEAMLYTPAVYLNEHVPRGNIVFGNHSYWITRTYYEGPAKFIRPGFAWYLDRLYLTRKTVAGIRRIIDAHARGKPVSSYYLFENRSANDARLGRYLRRNHKRLKRWEHISVFDLSTSKQPRGGAG